MVTVIGQIGLLLYFLWLW